MHFLSKKVLHRYTAISILLSLTGAGLLGKAAYIMFVERSYWEEVADRFVKENVEIEPKRGNILSADGQLLVGSLPEYLLYMDFMSGEKDALKREKAQLARDTLLNSKMDSLCEGLHRLFPDRSVKQFKDSFEKGRENRRRNWLIYPKRVSYLQLQEVRKLPICNLRPYQGGFYATEFVERRHTFGSLAARTLGGWSKGTENASSGLEQYFDSLLRGTQGRAHRAKVLNRYQNIIDVPAENGLDIQTTIDINLQDVCEKALMGKLTEINADVGVAIVMDVATGDVKAIANLGRDRSGGRYYEKQNYAVSNLLEPGSVFKSVSFLVAFDDGKIDTTHYVNVGSGVMDMHGRKMKDHNWRRGGYQTISVPQILGYSSNIGVSKLIDDHYRDNPGKFVDGIYRTGIAEDLRLPVPGYARPRIRKPGSKNYWAKTTLPWMSIGYETQIPPISTLAFYNGIANGGRMVKPRFVSAVLKNGIEIKTYPTETVREKMASAEALAKLQYCLRYVVAKGLGKAAGSKSFPVSGKTGTAQIWTKAGFSMNYLISFAGYFPSDKPRYSCIVCIQKAGLPASGGGMCGPVFAQIAEYLMTHQMASTPVLMSDTVHTRLPFVKSGDLYAADYVLKHVGANARADWDRQAGGNLWGEAQTDAHAVRLIPARVRKNTVPNVTGMGAKDALYRLESCGLKVVLQGMGQVVSQSLPAGSPLTRGSLIRLKLSLKKEDRQLPVSPLSDTLAAGQKDSLLHIQTSKQNE